ncbi:prepilin-type N-terminal cleavage/methylation domain-containing protein [Candidatus Saganbacteria bacterium]|nr:prepilin-type N-terminal cleavage/methylation domain-containing protein [Candidatus Saganbacteria bacterium]
MNKKNGFTLVELLISAFLCLIAVSAFSYLLKGSYNALSSAEHFSQAACQMRSMMESLRAKPFDQLPNQDNKSFAGGRGKIKIIPVFADLTKIQLELNWQPKRASLRLATLKSSY